MVTDLVYKDALDRIARLIHERDFWKVSYEKLHYQYQAAQCRQVQLEQRHDALYKRFMEVHAFCKKVRLEFEMRHQPLEEELDLC